jgi:hypothetical protein
MSKTGQAADNGSLQRYPTRSLRVRVRLVPKGRQAASALGAGDGAQLLGIDARTVFRWAAGEHDALQPTARLLRLVSLLRAKRDLRRLNEARCTEPTSQS